MKTPDVQIGVPVTFIILGATGDLTLRKLIPALYVIFREGILPENFAIIGFARREYDDESFAALIAKALSRHSRIPVDDESLKHFCSKISYHRGDLADSGAYNTLKNKLDAGMPENHLFYLSIAPEFIQTAVSQIQAAGLVQPPSAGSWTRVIVEKPFGYDLSSALALNQSLLEKLDESQIYRIDHYLGKETVQNILSFRLANAIFEPVFNRTYVDHIQITAAETVGMESGRGAYYDTAGALRDMVANHLFQLLCLVTMEPPAGFEAASIQNEKLKILRTLRLDTDRKKNPAICFAQYGAGNGMKAFREEDRVAPESDTETFVALRMEINNWRWAGVPIYLRTGKRLAGKTTQILVQFKMPPLALFQHVACEGDVCDLTAAKPNTLIFSIQPDEGIFLQVSAKRPAMQMIVENINMDFSYAGRWDKALPEAYERLLLDAMRGDATLFTRSDEAAAGWAVIDEIRRRAGNIKPAIYESGSWGPKEAEAILSGETRWYNNSR
ncbi:MAG: glucose-6-phosphate dehydrogenase [Kiritimatiellales bacterium]